MKTIVKMLPVMCLMLMLLAPAANAQQMQKKEIDERFDYA